MNTPKEGSRVIREGVLISETMDWCRSPTAIVPYRIHTHGKCQTEGANAAETVRQTDVASHVKGSLILQCFGDEPGVGGGVISGTNNAECTPKTWSETVRFEGRNAVRHNDEWWMNHKNTYGRLIYLKDIKEYDTPEVKDVKPLMYAQAGPMPIPAPVPIPPPIPQEQSQRAADALWKGIKGLAPGEEETFSEYIRRPLYNLGIKKRDQAPATTDSDIRISKTGSCTPEEHRDLQDRVENACGAAKVCKGGDPPEVIAAKIAAHYECIRARERINNTCFAGGDDGHNDAISQRKQAIATCWALGGNLPKKNIPK